MKKFASLFNFESIAPLSEPTNYSSPLILKFRNGNVSDININNLRIEGFKVSYTVDTSTEIAEKEISVIIANFLKSLVKMIDLQPFLVTYRSELTSYLNIKLLDIFTEKFINFSESTVPVESCHFWGFSGIDITLFSYPHKYY